MKSFSEFAKKTKVAEAKITKDKFYKNEVYKQGEWVLTENGQVGKILRRGPNYVLCLTAEETTFRTWITNIKEVFEIGTDAYREYVMSLTPGQKTQKPSGTVKVKQTIPTDPIKDKMSHHESKSLAQLAAETGLNSKFKSMEETWRYDKSAIIGNTDVKGLGADGVGGGDAPGMKLAEPKGEEGKPSIKKIQHSCATKVEHAEWGLGNCLKGEHTLLEDGTVTHYDVMFDHGLEKDVPVETLNIKKEGMHEHVARPEQHTDRNQVETELDQKVMVEPPLESVGEGKDHKKKKGKGKFWQDSDGDGKWYEDEDIKKEENVKEASLATARKNIGRDPDKPSCWKGYKAKGTKMKGGKSVPNCVKEFSEWRKLSEKK